MDASDGSLTVEDGTGSSLLEPAGGVASSQLEETLGFEDGVPEMGRPDGLDNADSRVASVVKGVVQQLVLDRLLA